jgi:hypothetical protein
MISKKRFKIENEKIISMGGQRLFLANPFVDG